MGEICKNCHNTISENFCGNCGQKKYKRIDKKYIWEEIQYVFLHTNKGFFYSIKQIIKNPGKTAKDFIEGNRVNHYKPILLAMVLGAISTFLSFKVFHLDDVGKQLNEQLYLNSEASNAVADFNKIYYDFLRNYYTIIMLSLIPFFSLASKWAFNKWGYNYFEYIVINTFYYILITIIGIILSPIIMLLKGNVTLFSIYNIFYFIITIATLIWFYKQIFSEKNNVDFFSRLLIFIALSAIIIFIIITIFGIIFGVYFALSKPELFIKQ